LTPIPKMEMSDAPDNTSEMFKPSMSQAFLLPYALLPYCVIALLTHSRILALTHFSKTGPGARCACAAGGPAISPGQVTHGTCVLACDTFFAFCFRCGHYAKCGIVTVGGRGISGKEKRPRKVV
jgi:hypothetical protein